MLQKTVLSAGVWGFVGAMLLMTGCGDDDGDAGSAVCDAQAQLDQDADELRALDLSATSVDDAEQILSNLGEDVQSLRDAGSDELSPHLDAIGAAVDDLGDTIGSLGSSASLTDAATAIQQSLGDLGDAAADLRTEIADDEDC